MWNDPIVEEVRKNRQKIFAECDYDLHKLFEREREFFPKLVEMGFEVYVREDSPQYGPKHT